MTGRDPRALVDLVDYVRLELDAGTALVGAVAAWLRRHTAPAIETITVEVVEDAPPTQDGSAR